MDERKQYWEDPKESWYPNKHALLEVRSCMAWELVRAWGSIAGIYMDREDSGKRAVMELQTPGALVTRCFAIADAFVNRAENREEIRQLPETQAGVPAPQKPKQEPEAGEPK